MGRKRIKTGRVITNLKERNKWFNSLPVEEKRVAIAKDVVESIKKRIFYPSYNYFVAEAEETIDTDGLEELDLQKYLSKQDKYKIECQGCALGGMFYSQVVLGNDVKICNNSWIDFKHFDLYNDRDNITEKLGDIFEKFQMGLIESAFERRNYCPDVEDYVIENFDYPDNSSQFEKLVDKLNLQVRKAIQFGYQYNNPSKRLIAICKNIIKNDGEFVV